MTREDELKKQLAEKYGITLGHMREIVSLQDKFVAETISKEVNRETGYFPSIRLPGFGIFYCPERKRKKLMEINKRNANI